MPNYRDQVANHARTMRNEARLESRKPNSIFVGPKRRDEMTLNDWIAKNPELKNSRSIQQVKDAYLDDLLNGTGLRW
jgi:hypothetical protein